MLQHIKIYSFKMFEQLFPNSKAICQLLKKKIFKPYCSSSNTKDKPAAFVKPAARSGHRLCADDNYVYLFGGYNPIHSTKVFFDLHRYNITTGLWTELPDAEQQCPRSTASSSMVLLNGNIFIFGGTGYPFALTNSNELHMYDLTRMRWYNLTELKERRTFNKHPLNDVKVKRCGCRQIYDVAPTPKYGQSMTTTSSHKLLIYSGTVGREFLDELHSFSLKTFRWTQYKLCSVHGPKDSVCRYRHEVVLHQNKLLILGGATMSDCYDFKFLNSFDFIQKRWTITEADSTVVDENGEKVFPASRKAHCCVRYGDNVYMTGGIDGRCATYNDFWILNLKKNVWRRTSEVNESLFYL